MIRIPASSARDLRCQGPCPQQHEQQHQGMGHARPGRLTTGFDVDHRSHGGSGTGESRQEPSCGVGDALADQFTVGVVVGLGDVVGHQGGEQRVDGSEQGKNHACFHQLRQVLAEIGKHQLQSAFGDGSDSGDGLKAQIQEPVVVEQQQR